MKYNGHRNRATWNVNLWIGNDEGLYRAAVDFVRNLGHRCTGADALDFMYQAFPEGVTPDGDRIALAHAPEVAAMLRELA